MRYLLIVIVLFLSGCTYKIPLVNHLTTIEMQRTREQDICNQTHEARMWWDDEGIHTITSKGGT